MGTISESLTPRLVCAAVSQACASCHRTRSWRSAGGARRLRESSRRTSFSSLLLCVERMMSSHACCRAVRIVSLVRLHEVMAVQAAHKLIRKKSRCRIVSMYSKNAAKVLFSAFCTKSGFRKSDRERVQTHSSAASASPTSIHSNHLYSIVRPVICPRCPRLYSGMKRTFTSVIISGVSSSGVSVPLPLVWQVR